MILPSRVITMRNGGLSFILIFFLSFCTFLTTNYLIGEKLAGWKGHGEKLTGGRDRLLKGRADLLVVVLSWSIIACRNPRMTAYSLHEVSSRLGAEDRQHLEGARDDWLIGLNRRETATPRHNVEDGIEMIDETPTHNLEIGIEMIDENPNVDTYFFLDTFWYDAGLTYNSFIILLLSLLSETKWRSRCQLTTGGISMCCHLQQLHPIQV